MESVAGRPLTLGERRVRISFNPNQAAWVGSLKALAATFIDDCEALRDSLPAGRDLSSLDLQEMHRLISLAQTHAEDAAMWAVKAATIALP